METALARLTAKAVALSYEDKVKLLTVLAKSMSKPVSYASKKEDKNWSEILDAYTGCMDGLYGNIVILTNGFQKKTQKTPKFEIEVCAARMKDFLKRSKENDK